MLPVFYMQRYMQQYDGVELSALGMGMLFYSQLSWFSVVVNVRWLSSTSLIDPDMFPLLGISSQHLIIAAIATVVTVAEILKNTGFAVENSMAC